MKVCLACGRLHDDSVEKCPADGEELLPHEPPLAVGDSVTSDIRIVRPIGLGPCGDVFEGVAGDGSRVVVRLISEDLTKDRRAADALRRQQLKVRDFHHPGVVRLRELLDRDGRMVLVRDWVEGERLQDLLVREGALPAVRAVRIAEGVCAVLAETHKKGLLHLQVRASNVFVEEPANGDAPTVRLVDFGIGPLRTAGGRPVFGTLRSMAPEQLEGRVPSFKADLYGVGLLVFRMLTGSSAFSGTEAELVRRVVEEPLPPVRPPSEEPLPADLEQLVRQLAEKKAALRPPGMLQVLDRLHRIRAAAERSGSFRPSQPPVGSAPHLERSTVAMSVVPPKPSGESGFYEDLQDRDEDDADRTREILPEVQERAAVAADLAALLHRQVAPPAGGTPAREPAPPHHAPPPPPPPGLHRGHAALPQIPRAAAAVDDAEPLSISVEIALEPSVDSPAAPVAEDRPTEPEKTTPITAEEDRPALPDTTAPAAEESRTVPEQSPPGAGPVPLSGEPAPPGPVNEFAAAARAQDGAAPAVEPLPLPPAAETEPPVPAAGPAAPVWKPPAPAVPPALPGFVRPATAGSARGGSRTKVVVIVGAVVAVAVIAIVALLALRSSHGTPAHRGAADVVAAIEPADAAVPPAPVEAPVADVGGPTPEVPAAAGLAPAAPDAAADAAVDEGSAGDVVADAADAGPDEGPEAPSADEATPETQADDGSVPEAAAEAAPEVAVADAAEHAVPATPAATPASLVAAGNRALVQRQFGRAESLFRQALALDSGNRAARGGLGKAAFQQGQFAEAVRYFEPLYRTQGNMDLGVAYVRVGRFEDAKQQFERVLARQPDDTDARRALDAVNQRLGH